MDIEIVSYAREASIVNKKIAKFLSNQKNRLDIKAAVMNAISWDFNGRDNAEKFLELLKKKYKISGDKILDKLNPHELFSYGYLKVLDDYFNPQKGLPYLKQALGKLPESTTVAMIHALTISQIDLDTPDWCKVWKNCEQVFFSDNLNYDMRIKALFIILDYIKLYEENCK